LTAGALKDVEREENNIIIEKKIIFILSITGQSQMMVNYLLIPQYFSTAMGK